MQNIFRSFITLMGLTMALTACGQPAQLSCNLSWNQTSTSEAIKACVAYTCVEGSTCMLATNCEDVAMEIADIVGTPNAIEQVGSCAGDHHATGEMYLSHVEEEFFTDCYGENSGGQQFCELYFDE